MGTCGYLSGDWDFIFFQWRHGIGVFVNMNAARTMHSLGIDN